MNTDDERLTQLITATGEILKLLSSVHEDTRRLVNRKRVGFSIVTERQIAVFMHETGRRNCQCCNKIEVIGYLGERSPLSHFDHYYGPSDNSLQNCWLTCDSCNAKLREVGFRNRAEIRFKHFQEMLMEWLSHEQMPLFTAA